MHRSNKFFLSTFLLGFIAIYLLFGWTVNFKIFQLLLLERHHQQQQHHRHQKHGNVDPLSVRLRRGRGKGSYKWYGNPRGKTRVGNAGRGVLVDDDLLLAFYHNEEEEDVQHRQQRSSNTRTSREHDDVISPPAVDSITATNSTSTHDSPSKLSLSSSYYTGNSSSHLSSSLGDRQPDSNYIVLDRQQEEEQQQQQQERHDDPQETFPEFVFPTPEERVRYYMGSWYNHSLTANSTTTSFCKKIRLGKLTSIPSDVNTLYSFRTLLKRHKMKQNWLSSYLKDAANVLTHIESKVNQGEEEDRFVILRIGDSASNDMSIPSVSKARIIPKNDEDKKKNTSIIWPLRINYHFDSQFSKLSAAKDTPWHEKKNAIVWRGACTGAGSKKKGASQSGDRLVFVKKFAIMTNATAESKINIGMIGSCAPFGIRLEDKSYYKEKMNVEEMLTYKYLLSLEGNDVATGLKWKLASSSVVFMPEPKAESFAMEGLLRPFVHYIPVQNDGSDLEQMIQWAEEHDSKAKWISEQATEFMNNLWFSDKARMDNALIKYELGNVYHRQFRSSLQVCNDKLSMT